MNKSAAIHLLAILLLAGLSSQTLAQDPSTYDAMRPLLSCTPAIKNSTMVVSLKSDWPGAHILYNLDLDSESIPAGPRITYHEPASFHFGTITEPSWTETDPLGRCILTIPLDAPAPVGEPMVLNILMREGGGTGAAIGIKYHFTVMHPFLCFSSLGAGSDGFISLFDELEGEVVATIGAIDGRPEKTVFNRDASRGFVMLDDDRIAIFDSLRRELNGAPHQTGLGLSDIEVTPDGRKLIALTRGVDGGDTPFGEANLWIYDIEKGGLSSPYRARIDPVSGGDAGRILAVSEDSQLVFVRRDDLTMGEYDLLEHEYRRFQIGGIDHLGGKVRDMAVCDNRLLILVAMPDQRAYLQVVNTQTYHLDFSIPVGMDPREIHLYRDPYGRPLAVIHDRSGASNDMLYLADFQAGSVLDTVSIPDGLLDMDLSEAHHLCMMLYYDDRTGRNDVVFLDLRSMRFQRNLVILHHGADARACLSGSAGSRYGFVYSPEGVSQIDIKDFDVIKDKIPLEGLLTGCAVEIHGVPLENGGSGEIAE